MLSEYWSDLFQARSPWSVRQGRWQWQLLGCAVGLLAALALHPRFSWLLKEQCRLLLPVTQDSRNALQLPEKSNRRGLWAARMKRVGEELKYDPNGQVAYALMSVEDNRSIARYWNNTVQSNELGPYGTAALACVKLRDVMQRFPNSALARAAFLRNGLRMVHTNAPIRFDVNGIPVDGTGEPIRIASPPREVVPQSLDEHKPIAPTKQVIADCLQAAKEGEALEPNNAYFPAMQAIVHFSWNKVDEALYDLDRASQKPDWHEHIEEEIWGRWRVAEMQLGHSSSLTRLTVMESMVYPNYSDLRNLARGIVWQANLQERAGHAAASIALRGRMMRMGANLRDHSPTIIGCLVGVSIIDIAMSNPGRRVEESSPQRTTEQTSIDRFYSDYDSTLQRLYDYTNYLRDKGFEKEARWVHRQVARNIQARSLHAVSEPFQSVLFAPSLGIIGLCLLTQIFLLGAIGLVAAVVNYRRRFACGSPRPLPLAIRYGIGFGTVAAWAGLYVFDSWIACGGGSLDFLDALWVTGALLVGAIVAIILVLDQPLFPFVLATFVTLAGWGALVFLASWPAPGMVLLLNQGNLLTAYRGGSNIEMASLRTVLLNSQIGVVPAVAMGMILLIGSRARRIPGFAGVVQGLGKALVPTIALLLLCFCGTIYAGVVRESQNLRSVENLNENEVAAVYQPMDAAHND